MISMIGILCWYDENPSWLAATTASMARAGVSHIVGLDGAYALYPGAMRHPRSGAEQYAAVMEVCQAMQIGLTIHGPYDAYAGNECEKRTLGFKLAEQVAEEGDWYILMDADQVITQAHGLPRDLEDTEHDVAEALFYSRVAGDEMNGQRALWPVRCMFRAIPGLEVKGQHFSYVLPDGRDLWGEPPYEPAAQTRMEVEHRTMWRPKIRQQAQDSYYKRRDETGIERPQAVRGEI